MCLLPTAHRVARLPAWSTAFEQVSPCHAFLLEDVVGSRVAQVLRGEGDWGERCTSRCGDDTGEAVRPWENCCALPAGDDEGGCML